MDDSVVSAEELTESVYLLGLLKKKGSLPKPSRGEALYLSLSEDGKPRSFYAIAGDTKPPEDVVSVADSLYRVRTGPHYFAPVFPKTVPGPAGNSCDLILTGDWRVIDGERLLRSALVEAVRPGSPLSAAKAERKIMGMIRGQIEHKIKSRQYTYEDINDRGAISPQAMSSEFSDSLKDGGIAIAVDEIVCKSLDVDEARAEAESRKKFEQAERLERERLAAEDRRETAKSEFKKRREALEHARAVDQLERTSRLGELEKERLKRMAVLDFEIAEMRRREQKAAAEHEITLAEISNSADARERIEERERENESRYAEEIKGLQNFKAALEDLPDKLIQQLSERVGQFVNPALDKVVMEYRVPLASLRRFGMDTGPQLLIQSLHQKSIDDEGPVAMSIPKLLKRDIVTSTVESLTAESLRIEQCVGFDLHSRLSGHLTVLNFGTSGKVWLHVPNVYVGEQGTRITAGRNYSVPGPDFMPLEQLGKYGLRYEAGPPPGWEHLVAIVSSRIVVPESMVRRSLPQSPLVAFTSSEIKELVDNLASLSDSEWAVGVLDYWVVEK